MNPVLLRELRERFRSLRSPVLLSLWVLAGGAVTFLAYQVARSAASSTFENFGLTGFGSLFASASMGRFILHSILLGMLTAVVFVVPGQAAVSIVGERERQTLPLLQVSQLSAWRIVWGKLMAALAYIVLLMVATLPLLVIPVLIGGVSLGNVLAGMAMVLATSVMLGSVSIWISARAKSVQGAVLGSYMWAAFLVFGTLALLVAEFVLVDADVGLTRFEDGVPRDRGRELYSAVINPYVGLVDASSNPLRFESEVVTSPYLPFRAALIKRQGFAAQMASDLSDPFFIGSGLDVAVPLEEFGRGGRVIGGQFGGPGRAFEAERIRPPAWPGTLLFQLTVSALALYGATNIVRAPSTTERSVRRRRKVEHAS